VLRFCGLAVLRSKEKRLRLRLRLEAGGGRDNGKVQMEWWNIKIMEQWNTGIMEST
jgi:hypothetical protein